MKEFITLAILQVGNIPLIYLLKKDWFDKLTNTNDGNGQLFDRLVVGSVGGDDLADKADGV
jgi:hypothetical protein